MKNTEKRQMKNFRLEELRELCRRSEERSKEMLEVTTLETKILSILKRVAPMKIKTLDYQGKPK